MDTITKEKLESIDFKDVLDFVFQNTTFEELMDDVFRTYSMWDIVDYIETKTPYICTSTDPQACVNVMNPVEALCREIQPKGIITKEAAKKLISDWIDTYQLSDIRYNL